jgi:aspartyl-tRNA synthetase
MPIGMVPMRSLRLRSSYIKISNILRGRAAALPRQCYRPLNAPRYFHARACLQQEPPKELPAFLEAYKRAGMSKPPYNLLSLSLNLD